MKDKNIILPVQPYLLLDAENYHEILTGRMGISNFYEFHVQDGVPGTFMAVPDGSTDLVFGIGERDVKVFIGGTVLRLKAWKFEEGRYYFGVRFLPGKSILPDGLSIQDVVNTDLEIDRNEYGQHLTDSLAEAAGIRERAEILCHYLEGNRKSRIKDTLSKLEEYMRKRIYATSGSITIQMLSRETGYSECYIRRVFRQIHGISPKEFERFIRFQALLNRIGENAGKGGSQEAALSCGYHDQSHMMKDFRMFAGTTPEKYRKLISRKAEQINCDEREVDSYGIGEN